MSDHHAAVSVSISAHLPGAIPGQPLSEPKSDKEQKEKKHHADGDENDSGSEKEKKKRHPDIVPIMGYEDATFSTAVTVAPPSPVATAADAAPQKFNSTVDISKDQAKHALLKAVSKKNCHGKECAKEMDIKKITTVDALRYTLETYTQQRQIKWVFEPYNDHPVDGPENGPAPAPWTIDCPLEAGVQMHTWRLNFKKVEVPHTAVVTTCFLCKGTGEFKKCPNCKGDGDKTCEHCKGKDTGFCLHCLASGKLICITCRGQGSGNCSVCNEHRKVKQFIQMTVVWKYQRGEFIHEKSDLPDDLVRLVQGEVIFEQDQPQVNPITSYPVNELNKNSALLIEKHRSNSADMRIVRQRHQLRVVPVAEIEYQWKNVKDRYWVFGKERHVHAPKYPQQCCCTLL